MKLPFDPVLVGAGIAKIVSAFAEKKPGIDETHRKIRNIANGVEAIARIFQSSDKR